MNKPAQDKPAQYALRDNAIYNPHLLGKEELIALFSARESLLRELLDDLARCRSGETAQHHLIVAHRGMGKTMLLRRLQLAIEEDPDLSTTWLPLAFPEEQYNVGKLSDVWLNTLDALGDSLERHGHTAEAEKIDAALDSLIELPEDERCRKTLALLTGTSQRLGQRFVLLIDNIDLILGRIGDQAWSLRETLSEEPALLLVGASPRALEASYKYDEPFYNFFHLHELRGLTVDETVRLLNRYAEHWQNAEVLRVVREEPERIRTLHALTDGNPRTVALLYNILARGVAGDVRTDLESLLDQCTPLYKARLEALPAQQQRIVHALAVHWHPATAAEVAEDLRIEVNAVSSQLSRLVKDGTVEAVTFDPGTKSGYQLAERFFNIWYLMRATRRARHRLIWFVEFLKRLYGEDELPTDARQQHDAKYSSAGAQALPEEVFEKAEAPISGGDDELHAAAWSDIVLYFRQAVAAGKAREAADLLDRAGLSERWLPLREALETLALGRREYLRRLAPEVRGPVEEILEQLGPANVPPPAEPKSRRSKKRR